MSTSRKFYSLSEELLTAIAEELGSDIPHLKALRLSSRRFAYLDRIRKILFAGIQLVASPDHIQQLALADISQIAPFAKSVTFTTPFQCWPLTFEGFRNVILIQAMRRYASDLAIPHSYAFEDNGYQRFIEEHWKGKFPLSNDQIRVEFEKYHNDASAAKEFLLGEELKVAWTSALRALPNIRNLRFTSAEIDESGVSHLPAEPDCIIRPHHHGGNHRKEIYRRVAGLVGDNLFAAGIACLADTDMNVQSLNVECAMTGQFGWEALPGWEELDLSQMQTFTFQPQVSDEDLNGFGDKGTIGARAADSVAAVLKKCQDSLQNFSYESCCPSQWPGDEVISLPKLKKLSHHEGCIRSRNLKAWMAKMLSLEYFHLEGSRLYKESYTGWLNVFDAIRNHPKTMHVDFNQIITEDCTEMGLDYHTDDFERYLGHPEAEDRYENIERSLALYLSGKIKYNACLREWLMDEEEEEDEEYQEDEEDEMYD